MKNNRFLPQLALLIAAVIWGTSFVVMKNTVDIFPVNTLLAIRFGLGALILAVLSVKKLRRINKYYQRFCRWHFHVYGIYLPNLRTDAYYAG